MNYSQRDFQHIWHPYTQMETDKYPFVITKAEGSLLFSDDDKSFIDAISSWWVNLHGHCHPEIGNAIARQYQSLDQIIFAGFSHPVAIEYAEDLVKILPENIQKIFYSDNGSTAVEVGLKMAVQYWHNKDVPKGKIIALENSYHGDTFGSMSVSQRGQFTLPFQEMLFDVEFLVSPAQNAGKCLEALEKHAQDKNTAAFIYEPLVQGAGGMLMYEPEILEQMLEICRRNNVVTIADEVMTGFGRTGKLFASNYCTISPDIICLSKGITGGVLPLAVTACSDKIYNAFLSSDRKKTFFHGHSYTGNALSIAAAKASLELLMNSQIKIDKINNSHQKFLGKLKVLGNVSHTRVRGTVLAFDVVDEENTSYFHPLRDQLNIAFLEAGVLLRPLGNTVYIMPPYCITEEELSYVYQTIEKVITNI
ncbi:MAG: adenosylmethionine--8-amino-7-oxononanoate transaminase [Spirochaetia bacterium]|nr:adenosylmethionine--8-amino-7-oxononanoate transaminase [Spirochaetia bacterium]